MSDDTDAFFQSEGVLLEPSEPLKKTKHGWVTWHKLLLFIAGLITAQQVHYLALKSVWHV